MAIDPVSIAGIISQLGQTAASVAIGSGGSSKNASQAQQQSQAFALYQTDINTFKGAVLAAMGNDATAPEWLEFTEKTIAKNDWNMQEEYVQLGKDLIARYKERTGSESSQSTFDVNSAQLNPLAINEQTVALQTLSNAVNSISAGGSGIDQEKLITYAGIGIAVIVLIIALMKGK